MPSPAPVVRPRRAVVMVPVPFVRKPGENGLGQSSDDRSRVSPPLSGRSPPFPPRKCRRGGWPEVTTDLALSGVVAAALRVLGSLLVADRTGNRGEKANQ